MTIANWRANWKTIVGCSAGGFCVATLFMLILTTTQGMTAVEMLPYFFVSWVMLSLIIWVAWKW